MQHQTYALRRSCRRPAVWLAATFLLVAGACNPDIIAFFLTGGVDPDAPPTFAITFVSPLTTQNAAPGAAAEIQWADVATVAGTSVALRVDRVDPVTRTVISEIQLTNADALADGAADQFDWDVTGVIVGSYQPVIVMSSPDGQMSTIRADGDFNVTSPLPTPTLSFTSPAAADVNVQVGNMINITWTDNGATNGDTQITLRLDPTPLLPNNGDDRTIGIVDAGDGGNTGTFAFDTMDSDNVQIAPGTYTLSATLADGVHDDLGNPIRVTAIGRIVIDP